MVGFELRLLPTDLSGDVHRFTSVEDVESVGDVAFSVGEGPPELCFEGQLLRRVESSGAE